MNAAARRERHTKKDLQVLFDDYLAETKVQKFDPDAFLKWLQPLGAGHNKFGVLWSRYFGMPDAQAAWAYRMELVRSDVAKIRIVYSSMPTAAVVSNDTVQKAIQRGQDSAPAFVSRTAERKSDPGYTPFDIKDRSQRSELLMQGRQALEAWVKRYATVAAYEKIDLKGIERTIKALSAKGF